ncbi:hypothetical protein ACJ41O_005458 [Fusarium nematophilum]
MARKEAAADPGRWEPRVQLEVWAVGELGQNPKRNILLARSLRETIFHDWHAIQVTPHSDLESSRDEFVPLTVELRHTRRFSHGPDVAEESLRQLFRLNLVPCIERLFAETRQDLCFAAIFPIGDAVTDEIKRIFSRCHAWKDMSVSSRPSAERVQTRGHDVMADLVHIAATVPSSAATILDASRELEHPSVWWTGGMAMTDRLDKANAVLGRSEMSQDFKNRYGHRAPGPEAAAEDGILEAWCQTLIPLEQFRSLASDVKYCVERLSREQAVSNQSLYSAVKKANLAAMALDGYRSKMQSATRAILERHGEDKALCRRMIAHAIAIAIGGIIAGIAATHSGYPAGLSTTMGGIGSAAGTSIAWSEILKLLKIGRKGDALADFDEATLELKRLLSKSKIILSCSFCDQVLKMPTDLMSRDERRDILGKLGVDLAELDGQDFGGAMKGWSLERFHGVLEDFERKRRAVMKDADLRELPNVEEG